VFYIIYFAKKLVVNSCKLFFTAKFGSIFYKKKFKSKLARNMCFLSSDSLSSHHLEKQCLHPSGEAPNHNESPKPKCFLKSPF